MRQSHQYNKTIIKLQSIIKQKSREKTQPQKRQTMQINLSYQKEISLLNSCTTLK
jgi:hypothetical protein